jgi:transcriptional regulator with XRE-family HTH domain
MERKRERAGRTMLNLAATIGRHVSVVSRYEAGLVRPSPEVFALLANALDCDIDELIASAPRPAPRAVRDPEPTTEAVA